jgi:hypothetical protein
MTPTKQFVILLIVLIATSLASAQIGKSGSHAITYHIYGNGQINGACDATNLVSKYSGYITAQTSGLSCFACVKMTCPGTGNTIYATVVDSGGDGFDLNEPPYIQLCGAKGIADGHCQINWVVVANTNCPGNTHGSPPPAVTPKSPPPPSSKPVSAGKSTTTRCGANWNTANSQCNSGCSTNADCTKGQSCFASLKSCTPKAHGETEDTFSILKTPETQTEEEFSRPEFQSDEAVAADVSTVTPTITPATSSSASTDIPYWAVALLVLGSLLVVAIFGVIILVSLLLRKY